MLNLIQNYQALVPNRGTMIILFTINLVSQNFISNYFVNLDICTNFAVREPAMPLNNAKIGGSFFFLFIILIQ